MAYTKQTWQNGDTITAEKLNHMEDGIGAPIPGGCLYITVTDIDSGNNTATLDKTFEEINNAFNNNMYLILIHPEGYVLSLNYLSPDYEYGWVYRFDTSLSEELIKIDSEDSVYYEYMDRS